MPEGFPELQDMTLSCSTIATLGDVGAGQGPRRDVALGATTTTTMSAVAVGGGIGLIHDAVRLRHRTGSCVRSASAAPAVAAWPLSRRARAAARIELMMLRYPVQRHR